MTDKAEKEIERTFELTREAWKVLDLICAEFESDPMSVQCFDARIVAHAIALVKERRAMRDPVNPFL